MAHCGIEYLNYFLWIPLKVSSCTVVVGSPAADQGTCFVQERYIPSLAAVVVGRTRLVAVAVHT